MDFSLDRRRVLALGAAAGAVLALDAALPGQAFAAKPKTVGLDACMAMTPEQMASASALAVHSLAQIKRAVGTIKDPQLRAATLSILDNPAPTLLARLDEKSRKDVCAELNAKGYLKDAQPESFLPPAASAKAAPQSFLCSPGSGYQSHHSYPGGLATHTAANLEISVAIFDSYKDVYNFAMDRDVVVAAQALHDLHKPWVFTWGQGGESRAEKPLAGTGEHHTLGVAESMVRGLPAQVVVAQACAHNHPGTDKDEAEVVGWITAAAIIAGKDPVAAGYLAPGGKTLPMPRRLEGFVTHLGDHDFVLTVPMAKWTIAALQDIARARYAMTDADLKGARFNALRNYVFSQAPLETLYRTYSLGGHDALAQAVTAMVRPA